MASDDLKPRLNSAFRRPTPLGLFRPSSSSNRPLSSSAAGQSLARTRWLSDDLLSQLTPDKLQTVLQSPPPGPLKACLDSAALSEREFAFRVADAWSRIHGWLEELGTWQWPGDDGATGFEPILGKRNALHALNAPGSEEEGSTETADNSEIYFGSLKATELDRIDERVDLIHHQAQELNYEDIKQQVLRDHVKPLSQSRTSMSSMSVSSHGGNGNYTKMDDLTAVVTAIVVQSLPDLSRLNRLLRIWTARIFVLRNVPVLLSFLEDAEVALKSGWKAISIVSKRRRDDKGSQSLGGLTRKDFTVMREVLEQKLTVAAARLDSMLDRLEGLKDSLPDHWLDWMGRLEQEFGDWVVAGERIMRQMERAKLTKMRPEHEQVDDGPKRAVLPISGITSTGEPHDENADDIGNMAHPDEASGEEGLQNNIGDHDGLQNVVKSVEGSVTVPTSPNASVSIAGLDEDLPDLSGMDNDFGDLLPPLRNGRRAGSATSDAETVVYGASSRMLLSSDLIDVTHSPMFPTDRAFKGSYPNSIPSSPPNSPPNSPPPVLRLDTADSPGLQASPDLNEFSPLTLVDSSFSIGRDELPTDGTYRPTTPPANNKVSDDQLYKQISNILNTMPGQFKLSEDDPQRANVNLNPPDLVLPRIRKVASRDALRRKASSSTLSSRAPTPSYTLTPASQSLKNGPRRPSSARGQHETKVYNLSRPNGGLPIRLFIRLVGENERVMVRVGGGWADLGEYLKEYATHHRTRSGKTPADQVDIRDIPRSGSSPPSRPTSAFGSPVTPLTLRNCRRSPGLEDTPRSLPRPGTPGTPALLPLPLYAAQLAPKTPAASGLAGIDLDGTPLLDEMNRSRSRPSSRTSWRDEDGSGALGLAGPTGRRVEMSDEGRAWVERVQERVRMASGSGFGGSLVSGAGGSGGGSGGGSPGGASGPTSGGAGTPEGLKGQFGNIGRAGGTKRMFRKNGALHTS